MPSAFVISLDFELYWGVHDKCTLDSYKRRLDGARRAIPRMLKLFEEYDIHATWATVGFLFFDTHASVIQALPEQKPSYTRSNLSPYAHLASIGESEAEDPYHYAADLLDEIQKQPGQEIASHTFSHYYCLEPGQTAEQFTADLTAAIQAGAARGVDITSLVFPRNQVQEEYLQICTELGMQCYRGTEHSWMYKARNEGAQSVFLSGLRFLDSYLNISGHNTHAYEAGSPANVRSSRFLRPFCKPLRLLEPLKIRRIKRDLSHAARTNTMYHLWWHPHNFGLYAEQNLRGLRAILEHVALLRERNGMESLNMHEYTTQYSNHD